MNLAIFFLTILALASCHEKNHEIESITLQAQPEKEIEKFNQSLLSALNIAQSLDLKPELKRQITFKINQSILPAEEFRCLEQKDRLVVEIMPTYSDRTLFYAITDCDGWFLTVDQEIRVGIDDLYVGETTYDFILKPNPERFLRGVATIEKAYNRVKSQIIKLPKTFIIGPNNHHLAFNQEGHITLPWGIDADSLRYYFFLLSQGNTVRFHNDSPEDGQLIDANNRFQSNMKQALLSVIMAKHEINKLQKQINHRFHFNVYDKISIAIHDESIPPIIDMDVHTTALELKHAIKKVSERLGLKNMGH